MPPFRTLNDVFALNQFIAERKLESQLIRPEISYVGVNNTMFAGCAINGGFDGGAEAVEQQKVAIVEIVGEAH